MKTADNAPNVETKHIWVTGVVQGVGFRPFVYGLATRLALRGWVCNTSAGVEIVVAGDPSSVRCFVQTLSVEPPPLARVDGVRVEETRENGLAGFTIRESESIMGAFQPISPDVALCRDCERELFEPLDRHYLYPFINCTNCGPRFSIIKDLPYDRTQSTMADFEMCEACRKEYGDPLNRRFHAQPVACPQCGPHVWLVRNENPSISVNRAAMLAVRRLLREGGIVAIKGLGGFHLACDASNAAAVTELRRRKARQGKPLGLMAASVAIVEKLCWMSDAERALLTGREKPIVLLQRRRGAPIADEVAPGVDRLGVMLPYTPLHHLLINQADAVLAAEPVPPVLVMTSGNFSEEPIAISNEDALERLAPLADAFLLHNREIHVRCDDSVVRLDHGRWAADAGPRTTDEGPRTMDGGGPVVHGPSSIVYLRRSRGYAPYPVRLPFETRPTLAVGGELKNTFCLTRDRYAFLSQHIGDMENAETFASFEQGVEHLGRLFRIEPGIVAHDMHPGYFTTRYAMEHLPSARRIAVQHHHAHIAACMADNGLEDRKVIGLAFDGTGYGTDGAIWGGEALVADYAGFERAAHLEYLPLPGGDAAIRHPWRIAAGYAAALDLEIDDLPLVRAVDSQALSIVRQQVARRLNAPETSSMGRLFDAVAALAGVRSDVTYEAQAAIELEVQSRAHLAVTQPYPFSVDETGTGLILRLRDLLSAVIADAGHGAAAGLIGARFHHTVAAMALETCRRISTQTRLREVALSGGVWQNQILLDLVRADLEAEGFTVYVHHLTPANDGGLALGQAAVAAYLAK